MVMRGCDRSTDFADWWGLRGGEQPALHGSHTLPIEVLENVDAERLLEVIAGRVIAAVQRFR
jgi:hypothetical protein